MTRSHEATELKGKVHNTKASTELKTQHIAEGASTQAH